MTRKLGGKIALVIGASEGGPLDELTLAASEKVMAANLRGPRRTMAPAVVAMASLPSHVNMPEAVVLPVAQMYLGRG